MLGPGVCTDSERLPGAREGGPGGWCDPKRHEIVVAHGPANRTVRTLVHEIAHAHGLGYADYGREQAEVLVDGVTYCVLGSVGLDVGGELIPYVAGWGEDGALSDVYNHLLQRAQREHGEAFDRLVRAARERLYGADPDDEKATEERSIRTRIRTRARNKTLEDVVDEWRDQEERP